MKNFMGIVLLCLQANVVIAQTNSTSIEIETLQATSFFGTPLLAKKLNPEKHSVQIKNYSEALVRYQKSPENIENIIWVGRRIAYLGDYKKAIKYFSQGIKLAPNDARLFRHRGHRFISTRQLDKAIKDFTYAASLIVNQADIIEPDGIPNKLNIPLSSLHTNIYYHLGLAYYLKHDFNNALQAFTQCLKRSKNDDMRVAASHWLYMINKRINKQDAAKEILIPIDSSMHIIENTAYFKLLLFYKGELTESEIVNSINSSGTLNEAIAYGVANWYWYNLQTDKAKKLLNRVLNQGNWAAFGYLAAEADLAHRQSKK